MEHLTSEELVEFITMSSLSKQNLALAARVNAHVKSCKFCLDKLRGFEGLYAGAVEEQALVKEAMEQEEQSFSREIEQSRELQLH